MPEPTKTDAVGEIDRILMLLVRRATLPRTHELVARAAGVNLERGALVVLARLDELGPIRPSELARILGVEPSTVTRHVQELCRRALVAKHPDPTDGRSCVVELNSDGRRALNRFRSSRRQALAEVLASWDGAEVNQLARSLDRLLTDLAGLTETP